MGRVGGLVLGSSVNPAGAGEVCTLGGASESPGRLGNKTDSRPHPGHSDIVVWVGSELCTSPRGSWLLGPWPQLSRRQWAVGPGHGPGAQRPWSSWGGGGSAGTQWAGLESSLLHQAGLQGMKTAPHSRPRGFKLFLGKGESLDAAARPPGFESQPRACCLSVSSIE